MKAPWLILALLSPLAWAQQPVPPAPQLGALKVYTDWIVGCDNAASCKAVSLLPDREGEWGLYSLVIERGPGAGDGPELSFRLEHEKPPASVAIVVDEKVLAKGNVQASEVIFDGAEALKVARALARGNELELTSGDAGLAQLSLAGLSAALRYMDAQQGRADGVTAIVARGAKPGAALAAAPVLPVIKAVIPSVQTEPARLQSAEIARAIKAGGCEDQLEPERVVERGIQLSPLDAARTLVLLPCGIGAYQAWFSVLIARGTPGSRQFAPAPFDDKEVLDPAAGVPILTEPYWNPTVAELHDESRGRGVGDCSSSNVRVWDGNHFRLVQAEAMPECRGSMERITIWRATVTGR